MLLNFRSYAKIAAFYMIALTCVGTAQAGQLFPPNNLNNPLADCPNGEVLSWKGGSGGTVQCVDPTLGVNASCPSGQILTGITFGTPNCLAPPLPNATPLYMVHYDVYGYQNINRVMEQGNGTNSECALSSETDPTIGQKYLNNSTYCQQAFCYGNSIANTPSSSTPPYPIIEALAGYCYVGQGNPDCDTSGQAHVAINCMFKSQ